MCLLKQSTTLRFQPHIWLEIKVRSLQVVHLLSWSFLTNFPAFKGDNLLQVRWLKFKHILVFQQDKDPKTIIIYHYL